MLLEQVANKAKNIENDKERLAITNVYTFYASLFMWFVCVKTLYFVNLDCTLPGNELTIVIGIPLSTLYNMG